MSQVINDTTVLKNLYGMLGIMLTSGINHLGQIYTLVEQAKNSGDLEPENYEQLMSSGYLGSDFQQEYYSAYQEQIPKMQTFLLELEKKLNDYLQVR